MANIVEVDNEPGDLEGLKKDLTEAVTAQSVQEADEPAEQPQEVNNDPLAGTKFEGKSIEDILDSYNNLQSAYGRMANDLGTQRKLTDQLLDLKRDNDLQQQQPDPLPTVDTTSLLDNPTEALDRYISEREARIKKQYDERLSQFESQLQADRFLQKHPDFMEVAQSEEFNKWATENPLRAKVAGQAAQGDWDAADALLNEYKAAPPKNPAPTADLEAAKAASLETAASSGATSTGKVYRRADLIKLKLRDPAAYSDPGFQQEILKAYSEGRVK